MNAAFIDMVCNEPLCSRSALNEMHLQVDLLILQCRGFTRALTTHMAILCPVTATLVMSMAALVLGAESLLSRTETR